MSDSLYSAYDSYYSTRLSPTQLGGVNRVKTARRDRWGRLLPKSYDLPKPECHGRQGGIKRAATAKRINGKFAKGD